jgi:hypothetical protein
MARAPAPKLGFKVSFMAFPLLFFSIRVTKFPWKLLVSRGEFKKHLLTFEFIETVV